MPKFVADNQAVVCLARTQQAGTFLAADCCQCLMIQLVQRCQVLLASV